MKRMTARALGIWMAGIALAADQLSKIALLKGWGFHQMQPGEVIPVTPFFNLVMVWNPGISYGLFAAQSALGTGLLVGAALAVMAILGWLLWNTNSRVLAAGYGLIIGGGIGNNLVDRLLYGKVADFFHFHGFGYDWYVFNVADVAVTLGAIAIIYDVLKPGPDASKGAETRKDA